VHALTRGGRYSDKTIKLWKVFEKSLKVVAENNLSGEAYRGATAPTQSTSNLHPSLVPPPVPLVGSGTSLRMPTLTHHDTIVAAVPRKIYANAHAYHINSISVNSDGETYISADDLRINLWNLNISDQSFSACALRDASPRCMAYLVPSPQTSSTSSPSTWRS
jgi:serine/threonine-protein phosphatase 2A regulatory subunit B